MAGVWAKIIVLVLAGSSRSAQAQAQHQDLPPPPEVVTLSPQLPPTWIVLPEPPLPLPPDDLVPAFLALPDFAQRSEPPTLSPQLPPTWIVFPEPPLPSPPDAPIPDLGTLPGPPDKSKSIVKRALDRAMPNCLDAIMHTCWSSSPGDGMSVEEREFATDLEIGTYYFRNKNYRGAEFRFRHALESKPGQPEATFKLAESLNKLGKGDEAKQMYQAYLESQPNGSYAERARTALQRLPKLSMGKN